MTNFEVIKQLNPEQLADLLIRVNVGDIDYAKTFCSMCRTEEERTADLSGDCDDCWRWWITIDAYKHPQGLQYHECDRYDIGEVEK